MISEKQFNAIMKRYFESKGIKQDDDPDTFDCEGYGCNDCICNNSVGDLYTCQPHKNIEYAKSTIHANEAIIKRAEQWSKGHPAVTNRDKLEETFGLNIEKEVLIDGYDVKQAYIISLANGKSLKLCDKSFGDWLDKEYKYETKDGSEDM